MILREWSLIPPHNVRRNTKHYNYGGHIDLSVMNPPRFNSGLFDGFLKSPQFSLWGGGGVHICNGNLFSGGGDVHGLRQFSSRPLFQETIKHKSSSQLEAIDSEPHFMAGNWKITHKCLVQVHFETYKTKARRIYLLHKTDFLYKTRKKSVCYTEARSSILTCQCNRRINQ